MEDLTRLKQCTCRKKPGVNKKFYSKTIILFFLMNLKIYCTISVPCFQVVLLFFQTVISHFLYQRYLRNIFFRI